MLRGAEKAQGHDQLFSAEWKNIAIGGNGAVFENGSRVRDFLKSSKGIDVPLFDDTQPKLDWLIVAKSPFNEPGIVPKEVFLQPDGKTPGLAVSFLPAEKTFLSLSISESIEMLISRCKMEPHPIPISR